MDAQSADIQALRKETADSTAAARQAQQSVQEAQAAAQRAETAADKSTKAFELRQVKGKR
jgi:hypothetical protein